MEFQDSAGNFLSVGALLNEGYYNATNETLPHMYIYIYTYIYIDFIQNLFSLGGAFLVHFGGFGKWWFISGVVRKMVVRSRKFRKLGTVFWGNSP